MKCKKKIAISIGTRPEAIKMAPVYLELKTHPDFEVILLATSQHRQLLDQVLRVFSIRPDIDLDLMKHDQSLMEVSAGVLVKVQHKLSALKPDAVLVHGDTATCLFSSLAAFYEKIPIGHVEAGLRTYNYEAPWPEEMNRRLTDPLCRWCFAPTEQAVRNLDREGISADRIHKTGNTVVDALFLGLKKLGEFVPRIPGLDISCLDGKRMILVTGHRRESFGPQMEATFKAMRRIAEMFSDVLLVYPVHLNPNVRKPARQILERHPQVKLIEPVDYLSFLFLIKKCVLIITDSGGVQEEAPSLHKPVLVTRQTTERPEAIEQGCARLVGTDFDTIVQTTALLLNDRNEYRKMSSLQNPFGDGHAAARIVQILKDDI